ncbi:MAG: hypothetical protein IT363_06510 [Methanoregulaceae archaeon]|nr:hypothetical protein [Methanoregulaceae archaeon]
MMKQSLGLAVLALAICGCAKDKAATAPPTTVNESAIPQGWKLASGGGVSMALPEDWIAVDVSRPDVAQSVEHLGLKGAEGDALKQQIRKFASTGLFRIVAFAPVKPGEFQGNVNVSVMPIPTTDLNEVLKENRSQLSTAGKVIESGIVDNPKRAVIVAEIEQPTEYGVSVRYVTHVHLFVHGQEQITVSFGSPIAKQPEYKKIIDQVVKTFAYDPPKAGTP